MKVCWYGLIGFHFWTPKSRFFYSVCACLKTIWTSQIELYVPDPSCNIDQHVPTRVHMHECNLRLAKQWKRPLTEHPMLDVDRNHQKTRLPGRQAWETLPQKKQSKLSYVFYCFPTRQHTQHCGILPSYKNTVWNGRVKTNPLTPSVKSPSVETRSSPVHRPCYGLPNFFRVLC